MQGLDGCARTNEVDILWVVDNSPSMQEEQAQVATQFGAFTEDIDTHRLDFHIGVITTDLETEGQMGALQGTPTYITPDTPDYITAFEERIQVGIGGSARKAADDLPFRTKPPHLLRIRLDDRIAKADLTVARNDCAAVLLDAEDRCSVPAFQCPLPMVRASGGTRERGLQAGRARSGAIPYLSTPLTFPQVRAAV